MRFVSPTILLSVYDIVSTVTMADEVVTVIVSISGSFSMEYRHISDASGLDRPVGYRTLGICTESRVIPKRSRKGKIMQ
jgi:hypothetical protein